MGRNAQHRTRFAILLQAMLNGGEYAGRRIFSPAAVTAMTTNRNRWVDAPWLRLSEILKLQVDTVDLGRHLGNNHVVAFALVTEICLKSIDELILNP